MQIAAREWKTTAVETALNKAFCVPQLHSKWGLRSAFLVWGFCFLLFSEKAASAEFLQLAKLYPENPIAGEGFGWEITVDKPFMLVSGSGKVYVFRLENGNWSQFQVLTAANSSNNFGSLDHALALKGNTAVIGDSGNGAHVYRFNGVEWVLETTLVDPSPGPGTSFGQSVALDGDTILLSSTSSQSTVPGEVDVFRFDGQYWLHEATLVSPNLTDGFGEMVVLEGDVAAICAYGTKFSGVTVGAVYVYERAGSVWTLPTQLSPTGVSDTEYFGWPLDINQGTIAINAALVHRL
jgi:hypothetical protein